MDNYIHGGNLDYYLKRLNIKQNGEILDFSVNINPFGTPPIIKIKWDELKEYVDRYPTQNGEGVLEFYEERFDIDKDNIIAGNGSIELIYLAPKALNIRTAVVVEPSFYDYKRSVEINGCNILTIKLDELNNFAFELNKAVMDKIERSDAIILGNPNNPTGSLIDKNTIIELAKMYKDKWFLIDEAFIQFVDDYESKTLMGCNIDNIIIFHSLTKFYALAGLRVGAAIGQSKIIDKFKKLQKPWSVNAIAENAIKAISQCSEYEKSTEKLIRKERIRIEDALLNNKNIKIFKTHANFFLAKWLKSDNLDDLLRYLLQKGIFVRDCRNFDGLLGNFFRFAILEKEKNNKLIDALCEL
jgi:threonine-phosphate decarboxylase